MRGYWIDRYKRQGDQTVGNQRFSVAEFEVNRREVGKLVDRVAETYLAGDIVLDFGCGPARWTKVLTRHAFSVYGVDIVPWAVERARKLVRDATFVTIDGQLPFKAGAFDSAFSWTVLQHVPPHQLVGTISELERVVKVKLVLFENTSDKPDKPHIWFRQPVEYANLLGHWFNLTHREDFASLDGNDERHTLMVFRRKHGGEKGKEEEGKVLGL